MRENTNNSVKTVAKNLGILCIVVLLLLSPISSLVVSGADCLSGLTTFTKGSPGITANDVTCDDTVTYNGNTSIKYPELDDSAFSGDDVVGTYADTGNTGDYSMQARFKYTGNSNQYIGLIFNIQDQNNFEHLNVQVDDDGSILKMSTTSYVSGSGYNGNGDFVGEDFPNDNSDFTNTWLQLEATVNNGANTIDYTLTEASTGNVISSGTMSIAGNSNKEAWGPGMISQGTEGLVTYYDSGYSTIDTSSDLTGIVQDTNGNPIENATVSTENGATTTTGSQGNYTLSLNDGTYNVTANKQNYKPQTRQVTISGSDITQDFTLEKIESGLKITGPNFVRPNETIPYAIEYTNDTGTYDVTDYANVTSNNTAYLTINEVNRTMTGGVNNTTVDVTAEYSTSNESANVTKKYYVSYLKLENIDTVPPAKWIQAFLGFDDGYAEGQNMEGIGSDMQWLLFIVIIMSTFAKLFDNPWAGIGSGMVTGILLWVLEYIGLGLLLSTVFFGIFVGLILVRVRRDGGNEVTINEG